jgi:hypothetical protein
MSQSTYKQFLEQFESKCKSGNASLINWMRINKFNWNWGLCESCLYGYEDIAILMIKNGATDWDGDLEQACMGGHIDIVELMIKKELRILIRDWNKLVVMDTEILLKY